MQRVRAGFKGLPFICEWKAKILSGMMTMESGHPLLLMPPPELPAHAYTKPPRIRFPEDTLRRDWERVLKRESSEVPVTILPGSQGLVEHPIQTCVNKQMEYINRGYLKQDAFVLALEDRRQQQLFEDIERKVQMSQAADFGVQAGDLSFDMEKAGNEPYEEAYLKAKLQKQEIIMYDFFLSF